MHRTSTYTFTVWSACHYSLNMGYWKLLYFYMGVL